MSGYKHYPSDRKIKLELKFDASSYLGDDLKYHWGGPYVTNDSRRSICGLLLPNSALRTEKASCDYCRHVVDHVINNTIISPVKE